MVGWGRGDTALALSWVHKQQCTRCQQKSYDACCCPTLASSLDLFARIVHCLLLGHLNFKTSKSRRASALQNVFDLSIMALLRRVRACLRPAWPGAVYLVQGLLGLSRLAVFTFFKADLQLDPAEVGFLTTLGFAPWVSCRLVVLSSSVGRERAWACASA